jgi:hypothetical protein
MTCGVAGHVFQMNVSPFCDEGQIMKKNRARGARDDSFWTDPKACDPLCCKGLSRWAAV